MRVQGEAAALREQVDALQRGDTVIHPTSPEMPVVPPEEPDPVVVPGACGDQTGCAGRCGADRRPARRDRRTLWIEAVAWDGRR